MNILDFINLNYKLCSADRFTENQWTEIVNNSFSMDKKFNDHVTSFYTEYLGFDIEDCEDLITDIEQGDGDGFERFIDDIIYFCNR